MLEVQTLTFDYQDKPLLHDVQFALQAGQLLHLQGSNGAGKTTLLKLIAGLLQPHAGEIRYEGKAVHDDPVFYRQQLCYVGHRPGLNPLLTIKENCYFDLHWERQPSLSYSRLLASFGLADLANEPCYHLSAGQLRRVSLLRIAMTDARLWLLDEPFVALDKAAIEALTQCLEHHVSQGGQVILTSHQRFPFHRPYVEYCL